MFKRKRIISASWNNIHCEMQFNPRDDKVWGTINIGNAVEQRQQFFL